MESFRLVMPLWKVTMATKNNFDEKSLSHAELLAKLPVMEMRRHARKFFF